MLFYDFGLRTEENGAEPTFLNNTRPENYESFEARKSVAADQ